MSLLDNVPGLIVHPAILPPVLAIILPFE